MKNYLNLIDTNTSGNRCDVTPLFNDHTALAALTADITEAISPSTFDFVAGIDALGFILGTAVAIHAERGFIPIRKGGKLPVDVRSVSFVDYSQIQKSLEIRANLDLTNARILLVDEWIETATQVRAAITLIEGRGGAIAGIATISMDANDATHALRKTYRCFSAAA